MMPEALILPVTDAPRTAPAGSRIFAARRSPDQGMRRTAASSGMPQKGAAAMALATGESRGLSGRPQRPIFGPAVWGWALASGLALWALGFVLLPWWAALFIWWWPSIIGGAAVGLAAI